jgi:hypothetical protein
VSTTRGLQPLAGPAVANICVFAISIHTTRVCVCIPICMIKFFVFFCVKSSVCACRPLSTPPPSHAMPPQVCLAHPSQQCIPSVPVKKYPVSSTGTEVEAHGSQSQALRFRVTHGDIRGGRWGGSWCRRWALACPQPPRGPPGRGGRGHAQHNITHAHGGVLAPATNASSGLRRAGTVCAVRGELELGRRVESMVPCPLSLLLCPPPRRGLLFGAIHIT